MFCKNEYEWEELCNRSHIYSSLVTTANWVQILVNNSFLLSMCVNHGPILFIIGSESIITCNILLRHLYSRTSGILDSDKERAQRLSVFSRWRYYWDPRFLPPSTTYLLISVFFYRLNVYVRYACRWPIHNLLRRLLLFIDGDQMQYTVAINILLAFTHPHQARGKKVPGSVLKFVDHCRLPITFFATWMTN